MPLSMMCGATGACTSFSQQRADPLAADVALDGEDAGLVVQLLGHVLADALHARWPQPQVVFSGSWRISRRGRCAGSVSRLGCSFGLAGCSGCSRLDLGGQRRQVGVDRLFQQALLLGGEGLALGGELQPLEHRHLVRELVDGGLLEGRPRLSLPRRRLRAAAVSVQRLDACVFGDHGS